MPTTATSRSIDILAAVPARSPSIPCSEHGCNLWVTVRDDEVVLTTGEGTFKRE